MGKIAHALNEKSKCDDEMIVGSEIRAAIQELESELKKANAREKAAFMAGMVLLANKLDISFAATGKVDEEQLWSEYRCQDDSDWNVTDD